MVTKLKKALNFVRNVLRERAAAKAADFLRKQLGIVEVPAVAIVLGTGWGEALELKNAKRISFTEIPGFRRLGKLTGHKREVIYGRLDGQTIIALNGRVHANEEIFSAGLLKMVRLQIEMLLQLGVRRLILTCAAGGLPAAGRPVAVGDIVAINGFLTLLANSPMPLYAGEFYSADDVIFNGLEETTRLAGVQANIKVRLGGYAYVRGPGFEGRVYDKAFVAQSGVSSIGMSTLPEAFVCATYRDEGARVIPVAFITNSSTEEHSHEENMIRAKAATERLGQFLTVLSREFTARHLLP